MITSDRPSSSVTNAVASLDFESEGTPIDPATTDKYAQLATEKLTSLSLPTA